MEDFVAKHELQLYSMGFPSSLYALLLEKLTTETLDAGSFFRIQQSLNEKNEFLSQEAVAVVDLHPESNVFLIDHAWTTRISSIRDSLQSNYKLLNRLKSLVRIRGEKLTITQEEDPPKVFEDFCMDFDDQGLTEVPRVLEGTQGLSLWGNDFETISQIEPVVGGLKALWLNENPISKDETGLFHYFEESYPNIELLNSKLTKHAGIWAMQYISNNLDLSKVKDLDLSDRDVQRVSPDVLKNFTGLRSIDISRNKLNHDWENAIFHLEGLKKLKVDKSQEDWAWRNLRHFKCLKYINDSDTEKGKPELVDFVIEKLWGYLNTYRLSTEETYDENSIWYVLDEFGSSILHSDRPNCKLMPFLYFPPTGESITYSLLWPVLPIRQNDIIYRDFLLNVNEASFRSYRLCPWFQIPYKESRKALKSWQQSLKKPINEIPQSIIEEISDKPTFLKFATDLDFFAQTLSDPRFAIVDSQDADVIWTRNKLIDPKAFQVDKYLNQFPFETCVVMKNQLAQTIQKSGKIDWFPITFDLNHEFSAFMGEYLKNLKQGLDNHWIVKPINMSRGIDTYVTNSLDFVARIMETGPKVVQKYISNPFLLHSKKIDLRYIVLLKRAVPLEVLIYNHFWIRSANQAFTLSSAQQFSYETHFTVMNYSGHQMRHIKDSEFVAEFEESAHRQWAEIQSRIYSAIKELFTVATANGKMQREKSRAIYGVDVMLDSNLNPFILEVNFCPDCERATKYYPEFTNQVFSCLFYDETDGLTLL